jgi:imidazole glycerol-phosphate synthase subunit HisF
MRRIRVIPVLLLGENGLVKTVKFTKPVYVGDPINAVRILNEKEVDELILLDITATREKRGPALTKISEVASESFMPLAYGGGIRDVSQIKAVLNAGIEKVIINSAAVAHPELISEAAMRFGAQSVVVSMDIKKNFWGKQVIWTESGANSTRLHPVEFAQAVERAGAGEIFLNSIDRDGTYQGYDISLLRSVTEAVNVPVIACGGAGNMQDFVAAVSQGGASAVAAGSMFVFHGRLRGVLINYPSQETLVEEFFNKVHWTAACI